MTGLNGNKVYLTAALTAIYAIIGLMLNLHDLNQTVELLIAAGGMVGFRSALKKIE